MIALFDTNIYIDELIGRLPAGKFNKWRLQYILRLSPVVYHELLRGARNLSLIHEIRQKTLLLPAPSFTMWEKSAYILRHFREKFGSSEELHKLQNDILIALSARENGALLITRDKHFKQIADFLAFSYLIV